MLHIFPHIPSPRPWPPPLPRPCGPEWLDWLSRMSCDTVVIGHYNRINLFIFLIILNHSVNSTDCVVLWINFDQILNTPRCQSLLMICIELRSIWLPEVEIHGINLKYIPAQKYWLMVTISGASQDLSHHPDWVWGEPLSQIKWLLQEGTM